MSNDMPHDPRALAWLARVAKALEEVGALEYCGDHFWLDAEVRYGSEPGGYRILLSSDLDKYAVQIGHDA